MALVALVPKMCPLSLSGALTALQTWTMRHAAILSLLAAWIWIWVLLLPFRVMGVSLSHWQMSLWSTLFWTTMLWWLQFFSSGLCLLMAFQVERPQITEIQVRMDCNGCVQKIRRSLQTVQGIYKIIEDFGQQKIIVVGWADPEKVMRAIKKGGKIAKLCSHHTQEEEKPEPRTDAAEASASSATTVTQDPAEQTSQAVTEENATSAPAAEPAPPPPAEESAPPADPPQAGDAPPPETTDPPAPTEETSVPLPDPIETYYRTIDHNYLDGYNMTHDYHRDADYTRYNHNSDHLDAQRRYQSYMTDQYYNGGTHSRQLTAADSSRFATMFSDENPNACCIT